MFLSLFNTLKTTGVPCTLRELLDLNAAVKKNLVFADMQNFYYLSRAILVKDEKHYDKFDRAFDIYFKGIESIDDVLENAKIYSTSFNNEFCRVLIHGVLHLIGYNDIKEDEKQNMTKLENRYMALSSQLILN